MVKEMEKESLASRRKKARLCTMYKISNDIVHINKSKNLTPATETQTYGTISDHFSLIQC